MAKRHFQLNEKEVEQFLQAEQQTRDVNEMKRLQAVRLYGTGMPIGQIMDIHNCGESSIREWVQKYQQTGLSGLRSNWSTQNASKLTGEQQAELRTRLHEYHPDQLMPAEVRVSAGQFWTVSDLMVVVEQWYGVTYQDAGSYRNLFKRCGFSYHRAERVYKSRPSEADLAEFEAELEKK
jgi:putative transposase